MPDNTVPREVVLLQNSAERLTRAYKTQLFDKMNVAFVKRETMLHLRLTLRLMKKIYWGR